MSSRSRRLQSVGLVDGPAAARPEGYRHHEACRPVERTARQAGLPIKRKFTPEMWRRWLAEHNKIQAERLVGQWVHRFQRERPHDDQASTTAARRRAGSMTVFEKPGLPAETHQS